MALFTCKWTKIYVWIKPIFIQKTSHEISLDTETKGNSEIAYWLLSRVRYLLANQCLVLSGNNGEPQRSHALSPQRDKQCLSSGGWTTFWRGKNLSLQWEVKHADRQTGGQTVRERERERERDGQRNEQTDRQTDRQTETHPNWNTYINAYIFADIHKNTDKQTNKHTYKQTNKKLINK